MACSQQAVHVGQDRISLTVGVLHPDLVMETEPYPSPQQVIRYALDGVNATEANPLSVSAMASALMMASCHDIAAIGVAFFSRWQRYRRGQAAYYGYAEAVEGLL